MRLHERDRMSEITPPFAQTARVTRLDNGLTVVSETMTRVETVSLGAWVSVGTRHEQAEENGVAHFLEHMAFKGTRRRTAQAIAEEIEAVGGHLNAYTAREQTAYYAKVLKEDSELGIDIIADLLSHSTLDAQEMERERGVILQEIGQSNDTPDDIVFDHFQSTAFPAQPMGRPTLGTAETVQGLPRDALAGWLSRFYGPANMIVAAAGNIGHEQLLELTRKHFAALPGVERAATSPGAYQGGEHREERELDQTHIVLGFPGLPYGHQDYWAASLLSTLLGGGMSSRLFQEVREKRGLVYSIYTFVQPFNDAGLFGLYAGTGERQVAELLPVVIEELNKVQREVSEAELRRAKAQTKASVLMALESTSSRCEQIARQLQVHGRLLPTGEIVARIEGVVAEDVQRVAAHLFRGRPTLAAVGPLKHLPKLPAITERLAA
jgi:predicted Zn-dependent peptidase